ncbi:50S ribosomal protein L25/general stress protein Ctc [Romeria aff. gracilis LEGE 07310]|uniref:Large ribosomal subunit protein bL25 n=1 Tax=Vasconcelosia minhoensis LEGE 07310 TaxID=915328 RepID=A0A8J7DP00_9CYAN|nr:50S ribosomal protein L25/general stress protein Ctc [Romeria gracilis]MBE9080361.1 50S ribosomal protein L25/general stress protein Ctc [Romeria aff. gracilis LEGE 07310]
MELKIDCSKRADGAKPKQLRRDGLLPAVLYGHNGAESVSLTVQTREAEALLRAASVNKSVVKVNVPDLPWSGNVILREVQTHPWKNKLHHLSFFSIADQTEIEVTMPFSFVGEAVGVTDENGILDTVVTEMAAKCPPDNIPPSIEVDVSGMAIGDAINLQDLKLPAGVVLLGEPEQVIVSVLPPPVIKTEEPTSELDSLLPPEESEEAGAEPAAEAGSEPAEDAG